MNVCILHKLLILDYYHYWLIFKTEILVSYQRENIIIGQASFCFLKPNLLFTHLCNINQRRVIEIPNPSTRLPVVCKEVCGPTAVVL